MNETQPTPPKDAVTFGEYKLLKRLASGGMAELFYAQHPKSEKPLVIKRILPYLANKPDFVRMFLEEARIVSQLNHPNIIQVYELSRLDGHPYIAMEYVDGMDLRRLLKEGASRGVPLPHRLTAYIGARVASGLHYAHTCSGLNGQLLGAIHRDVSPQNVMIGHDGRIKLVDFGIAKAGAASELTESGVLKGKLQYMAPEQATNRAIDHRVDQFALGAMLYEIALGHGPFAKDTPEQVLMAICHEKPPAPHLVDSTFPVKLSRVVMRLLQKDPDARYPSTKDAQHELDAFLAEAGPVTLESLAEYVSRASGSAGRIEGAVADSLESLVSKAGPRASGGSGPALPFESTGHRSEADAAELEKALDPLVPDEDGPTIRDPARAAEASEASEPRPAPDAPAKPRKAASVKQRLLGLAAGGLVLAAGVGAAVAYFAWPAPASPPEAVQALPPPLVPDPTAANPTAADPTAANPTAANPTAANPTAANPTAANPTAANPTAANPTATNAATPGPGGTFSFLTPGKSGNSEFITSAEVRRTAQGYVAGGGAPVLLRFLAPNGTLVTTGQQRYVPGQTYRAQAGRFTYHYQCPRGDPSDQTVTLGAGAQVVTVPCP